MTTSPVDPARTPRVTMVSRRVHPAHGPGGLERHVFDLVKELADLGIQVDLFSETPSTRGKCEQAAAAFPSTVTLHWVRGGRLPVGQRKGTVVLDRVTNYFTWAARVTPHVLGMAGSGPRVVHVHGLGGWGLARAAARGRLVWPLVATMHGLEEFRSHIRLKHWAYAPFRRGIRTVSAHSTVLVTTDHALEAVVERYLGIPAAAQTVIPNAVDPERCRGLASVERSRSLRDEHRLARAAPVFLSVGRLEANKGFDVAVRALAQVAGKLPEQWVWVLVGDGPERNALRQAVAAAGLEARCVLTGRVDERDLHSWYAAADWFVHPTRYEGSSLVTLEAMAHGLPVVASRTGGLPDKVEEGVSGFLATPGDAAELGTTLLDAVQADREAFGAASRRVCESRFSWRAITPRYVELYQQLASVSPPARPSRVVAS